MAINYRVYSNDAAGGPVDYSSPIGTTAALSFSPPALAAPSDNWFGVRAFDTVSGLEELNTDARVRILIDAAGNDITALPNAPSHLAALALAGGAARVTWSFNPAAWYGQSPPASFKVWLTAGASVNYAVSPATTAAYVRGRLIYTADLSGLSHGTLYSVGVRATNATGDEANTTQVQVTGNATGPDGVDDLAATAV